MFAQRRLRELPDLIGELDELIGVLVDGCTAARLAALGEAASADGNAARPATNETSAAFLMVRNAGTPGMGVFS